MRDVGQTRTTVGATSQSHDKYRYNACTEHLPIEGDLDGGKCANASRKGDQ